MKKANSEKPVNCHNEKEVITAGLRLYHAYEGRDESVWVKTKKERKQLNRVKHDSVVSRNACPPRKTSFLRDKLIVQLKKNKTFPKTTYSIECWKHEIPFFVSTFKDKKGNSVVSKYYFNGRTYTV